MQQQRFSNIKDIDFDDGFYKVYARDPYGRKVKLIVDLMNEAGVSGMRFSISETAKWGDVSVGPKIVDKGVKKRMKEQLKEIQNGKFAKGWIKEYEGGYKKYNALMKAGEKHSIEQVGARLRSMMPWMQKRSIKGAQASY